MQRRNGRTGLLSLYRPIHASHYNNRWPPLQSRTSAGSRSRVPIKLRITFTIVTLISWTWYKAVLRVLKQSYHAMKRPYHALKRSYHAMIRRFCWMLICQINKKRIPTSLPGYAKKNLQSYLTINLCHSSNTKFTIYLFYSVNICNLVILIEYQ